MSVDKTGLDRERSSNKAHGLRLGAAIFILLLVAAYTIAIIAGLPKDRRIDAATLGIIGIAALAATILFRPDVFDRVTRLEIAGWKVEIEKRQQKQDQQLNDIQLILPVLLPDVERNDLLNLAAGTTSGYKGSHELRTRLRRLRSLKLIGMRPDHMIGGMTNDLAVDIGEFVELTELGERWVSRIKEIESEAAKSTQTRIPSD